MIIKAIELKLPTDYDRILLEAKIIKKIGSKKFDNSTYEINRKSLDARNKGFIHWNLNIEIRNKPATIDNKSTQNEIIDITYKKRKQSINIVGNGPAGTFAAFILNKAGFKVNIFERGDRVEKRILDIENFEKTSDLNSNSNYIFGEGGAGTFSDGKLTSRSKHIKKEKEFILDLYIKHGAPKEIKYLTWPHIGSDILFTIAQNFRKNLLDNGVSIYFNTKIIDIKSNQNMVTAIKTEAGNVYEADYTIFATGNSAFDTYKLLISKGVDFRIKNFALGCRVEHLQESINEAQWHQKNLPGVKAADYHLTFNDKINLPVYSFCMCPGGKIVPATSIQKNNIVNGMSRYKRDSPYANSAIVAATNLNKLLKREVSPTEAINWLDKLENKFYTYSNSYQAPANSIEAFMNNKTKLNSLKTSYPFGLTLADHNEMLPKEITTSLQIALKQFSRQIRGFDNGIILGLESKTSSPLQVIRDTSGRTPAFENLYVNGEGSGYAGGIVSSAADGIKAALDIIERNS